jgi:hypothetical protein
MQMQKIITDVHKNVTANYTFQGMSRDRFHSLTKHLDSNVNLQHEDDGFELLICSDPNCQQIHGIRYYFNSDDFNSIDVDAMEQHLDEVLNDWVESIISNIY